MPELVTYGPVSKRLLPSERAAGADLMLPGVIMPEEGLGEFGVGQKRCIRVQDNSMPIAVGKMLVSSKEVEANGLKGKGMSVIHVYRDALWTYSGRKIPNDGFLADEVQAAEGSTMVAALPAEEEAAEEEQEQEAEEGAEEEEADDAEEEMTPDALLEYCFYAALKTTCSDSELPISADKFYSHHMQPARPPKQPPLDAKRTSYKQIGKYIKQMHKSKAISVREVKNVITILSVDRSAPAYIEFVVRDSGTAGGKQSAPSGESQPKEDVVVALRTKPPVVTEVFQPNSYTKPLFEAMGYDAKNGYYTLAEAHKVLERYINEKLVGSTPAAVGGDVSPEPTGSDSVCSWLLGLGLTDSESSACASALVADGFDSVAAMNASGLSADEFEGYGVPAPRANLARAALTSALAPHLLACGIPSEDAARYAEALTGDGFESLAAMRAAQLTQAELERYGLSAVDAAALCKCLDAAAGDTAAPAAKTTVDAAAVPIDDMLLNSLIKLAGGQKKGATFPSHLPLSELKERMMERMTPFHKVSVEGEAPQIRKGSLKPICVEMKRAAGHNKTHISGLEGFIISPDAVAQALKIKLGCTTAVLKLPGNNVKEQEVLLQGHCVQEVVDYLRDVYCIDKKWLDLKLKK